MTTLVQPATHAGTLGTDKASIRPTEFPAGVSSSPAGSSYPVASSAKMANGEAQASSSASFVSAGESRGSRSSSTSMVLPGMASQSSSQSSHDQVGQSGFQSGEGSGRAAAINPLFAMSQSERGHQYHIVRADNGKVVVSDGHPSSIFDLFGSSAAKSNGTALNGRSKSIPLTTASGDASPARKRSFLPFLRSSKEEVASTSQLAEQTRATNDISHDQSAADADLSVLQSRGDSQPKHVGHLINGIRYPKDAEDEPAPVPLLNGKLDQDADLYDSKRDAVRMKVQEKLGTHDTSQVQSLNVIQGREAENALLDVRPRSPAHLREARTPANLPDAKVAQDDVAASLQDEPKNPLSAAEDARGAKVDTDQPDDLTPTANQPASLPSTTADRSPRLNQPGYGVVNSRLAPSDSYEGRKIVAVDAITPYLDSSIGSAKGKERQIGEPGRARQRSSASTETDVNGFSTLTTSRSNATNISNYTDSSLNAQAASSALAGPSSALRQRTGRSKREQIAGQDIPLQTMAGKPQQQPEEDFEGSRAKEAEAIRRARQEKRAEEEQALAEQEPVQKKPRGRSASRTSSKLVDDRVLVGNLIGEDHVNYVLMYNMLTGIRIGVSRCQAKLARPLTDADYTARHKFSFDIIGNELTPSAKYDFKFKDYAPWVFRALREYFHLDPADYLLSLTAKYILSELGSPGKSGSFFYFSRDYRFIIKTIRHAEHKFLRSILKDYHEHVKANPHTLLSRFYGLHRVKLPRGRKIHFVIFNNLFPPHRDVHETYDLKGSSIGREYPEEKAARNPGAVLKDLNWVRRDRHLELGPEKRALFEEQLRRDTELLQRLGIMDYSLLVGLHDLNRGNKDQLRSGLLSTFQPEQPATSVKRRDTAMRQRDEANASALRKAVQRSDPKGISETNALPDKDSSERRNFIFYADEGGFRASDINNDPLNDLYYLGVIDILTPYTFIKRAEHVWKSFSHDKHRISPVNPQEYGQRFMGFLFSVIRNGDQSRRPQMDTPEVKPTCLPCI
ncbi:uncharacterized protein L969DRAFT_98710 [Mixia osmundae IAM 14324]|uniref:1-phosphatidylinositol-4-phosphate 5-kinase n=1 Tax=Mixia osmundae (strain CBS 9802 / IAM 14324 / JCM 22182 / KY 12970) TaxID=764103 RepID=G7E9M6_MIXOS|nr:uncharacterized protein L969DRAFT_98710 [Mixia osmundae IAM 14324]KEI39975.1 hypothetical protein L969DRAFT_98710 [Mixia osmundae IAM 14324]GAA99345.1 hypothetical protein E5Q_06040 [Mixia osmundae IAM 14324]